MDTPATSQPLFTKFPSRKAKEEIKYVLEISRPWIEHKPAAASSSNQTQINVFQEKEIIIIIWLGMSKSILWVSEASLFAVYGCASFWAAAVLQIPSTETE